MPSYSPERDNQVEQIYVHDLPVGTTLGLTSRSSSYRLTIAGHEANSGDANGQPATYTTLERQSAAGVHGDTMEWEKVRDTQFQIIGSSPDVQRLPDGSVVPEDVQDGVLIVGSRAVLFTPDEGDQHGGTLTTSSIREIAVKYPEQPSVESV